MEMTTSPFAPATTSDLLFVVGGLLTLVLLWCLE